MWDPSLGSDQFWNFLGFQLICSHFENVFNSRGTSEKTFQCWASRNRGDDGKCSAPRYLLRGERGFETVSISVRRPKIAFWLVEPLRGRPRLRWLWWLRIKVGCAWQSLCEQLSTRQLMDKARVLWIKQRVPFFSAYRCVSLCSPQPNAGGSARTLVLMPGRLLQQWQHEARCDSFKPLFSSSRASTCWSPFHLRALKHGQSSHKGFDIVQPVEARWRSSWRRTCWRWSFGMVEKFRSQAQQETFQGGEKGKHQFSRKQTWYILTLFGMWNHWLATTWRNPLNSLV